MPEGTLTLREACNKARNEVIERIAHDRQLAIRDFREFDQSAKEQGRKLKIKNPSELAWPRIELTMTLAIDGRKREERLLADLRQLPYRPFSSLTDRITHTKELIIAHAREQAAIAAAYEYDSDEAQWGLMVANARIALKLNSLFSKTELKSDALKEITTFIQENQAGYLKRFKDNAALPLLEQRIQALEKAQGEVDSFRRHFKTSAQQKAAEARLKKAEERLQTPHFSDQIFVQERRAQQAFKNNPTASQNELGNLKQAEAEVARLSRFPGNLLASRLDKVNAMQDLMLAQAYQRGYEQALKKAASPNTTASIQLAPDNTTFIQAQSKLQSLFSKEELAFPEVAELSIILKEAEAARIQTELTHFDERREEVAKKLEATKAQLEETTKHKTAQPDTAPSSQPITPALNADTEKSAQETGKTTSSPQDTNTDESSMRPNKKQ